MDLASVTILLGLILVVFQFWRLRSIAEHMVVLTNQYCKKNQLQYISLARTTTKFAVHKGKLDWQLSYQLAFSSDGETEYKGELVCHGKYLISINLPPYKVPSAD